MEIAANDPIKRVTGNADLYQRIAGRAEGRLLPLPLQPDRLSIFDIGRQFDAKLSPSWKNRRNLLGFGDILNGNVEGRVDVSACLLWLRTWATPRLPEQLTENVACVESRCARSTGTKLET